MSHPPNRKTEFLLLLAVQIVLVFGLALVFCGQKGDDGVPRTGVQLNTATASQLAQALSIGPDTAQALVAARGRGWSSVYGLRHAKALKGVPTADIDDNFVVRTPADVTRAFLGRRGGVSPRLVAGPWRPAEVRAQRRPVPAAVHGAAVGPGADDGLQRQRPLPGHVWPSRGRSGAWRSTGCWPCSCP